MKCLHNVYYFSVCVCLWLKSQEVLGKNRSVTIPNYHQLRLVHTVCFFPVYLCILFFYFLCVVWELVMLSPSHSVNTSIGSCTTYLLRQEESQSQLEKKRSVNEPLLIPLSILCNTGIVRFVWLYFLQYLRFGSSGNFFTEKNKIVHVMVK